MSVERDLEIIEELPPVTLWGERFDEAQTVKHFKGKFVVTDDGKLMGKLFPLAVWDRIEYFHDMVVMELGIEDAKNMDVMEKIIGGGKIEIEFFDDHAECRLYGKSTIYGDYDSEAVDEAALKNEIREVFDLDEIPVLVQADEEE